MKPFGTRHILLFSFLFHLFSSIELRAFHVPVPVPSPFKVWHVLNKVTSVAAGVGDRVGKDLVLHPLNAAVAHVPLAGPLAVGVVTKVVVPTGRLAIHGIVGANNLASHAISGGEKVATVSVAVGRPVISGVGWVASNAGMGVVDLHFITAQTILAGANQMEKAGRVVTAVQVVGGYASQTMDDIGNARLGHAAQDLTELVASELAAASVNRVQQTEAIFSNARSALAANFEAIGCLRQGQWSHATVAMGRGMAAAGGVMTGAGHVEMGMAITQGGQAIEAEAPYAAHLVQILARARAQHVSNASKVVVESHPDPRKTALALSQAAVESAKAGRFQEATLRATTAVALISGTRNVPNDRITDAAILSAQSALAAMKAGQFAMANSQAADALGATGKAIYRSDPQAGQELVNNAVTLRGYLNDSPTEVARAQN
jgi:hypothetical protein